MKLYIREKNSAYAEEFVLVSGEEWDKLGEREREIITYNGEWKLAKKTGVKIDVNIKE